MDGNLARELGVDTAEIEKGLFMGREIATLERSDLLAIIGYFVRREPMVRAQHLGDLNVLAGRPRV